MKQRMLTTWAIVLAATAVIQVTLGYGWFHQRSQTVAEVICYVIAIIAAGFAIRYWGNRNYYP